VLPGHFKVLWLYANLPVHWTANVLRCLNVKHVYLCTNLHAKLVFISGLFRCSDYTGTDPKGVHFAEKLKSKGKLQLTYIVASSCPVP